MYSFPNALNRHCPYTSSSAHCLATNGSKAVPDELTRGEVSNDMRITGTRAQETIPRDFQLQITQMVHKSELRRLAYAVDTREFHCAIPQLPFLPNSNTQSRITIQMGLVRSLCVVFLLSMCQIMYKMMEVTRVMHI